MHKFLRKLSPLPSMVVVSLTTLLACQKTPPEQQLPAPEELPPRPALEFTEHGDGWPPQVRGITNVELIPWETVPGALPAGFEATMLDQLLRNETVAAALGERFAYITAEVVEIEKDNGRSAEVNAVFFSHSNNSTIKVQVDESFEVHGVEKIGPSVYQPPASQSEFKEAIDLARIELIELEFDLTELQSAAILAYPSQRKSPEAYFYDSRVIYVSFSKGEDIHPSLFALVDLTNQQILGSGSAAGSADE